MSLGPASQVCPPVVSLPTCTHNPSMSGLDVCSPRIMEESHPSGPVLERVVGHFLGSRVLARQTPGASRATKAGLRKHGMSREKFVCGNCGLEQKRPAQGTGATEGKTPVRPQLGLSCFRAEFPSSQARSSARFRGHRAVCLTLRCVGRRGDPTGGLATPAAPPPPPPGILDPGRERGSCTPAGLGSVT